jgi:Ca2+-binding RTX toxin-like protein
MGRTVRTGVFFQQRFDRDGNPVSPQADIGVNITTKFSQTDPSVTALAGGGWVVVWASDEDDGKIYQQAFGKDGRPASPQADLLVAPANLDPRPHPIVTALADGSWVVAWESKDGTQTDIHQQRFAFNRAPGDVVLKGGTVAEGAVGGTPVGTVEGTDVNIGSGDVLTYSLVDNAGGRFVLDGAVLKVANGLGLDYEQAQSHAIIVQATDKDGLSVTKTLTVQVDDVARETVTGSEGADRLVGGGDADLFRGMGGADTLSGGAGNDTLDGGAGADRLEGGAGNDLYVVDQSGDVVVEGAGGGVDTVQTAVGFTLGAEVEALVATGTGAIALTGNAFSNTLTGNDAANTLSGAGGNDGLVGRAGNDTLQGGLGNDRLSGGAGKDVLTGGAGKDVFVFDTRWAAKNGNVDKLTDFSVRDDSLFLDHTVFAGLGRKGSLDHPEKLNGKLFVTGTVAHDGDDRLIYDDQTGALYYDPDGNHAKAKVLIATLKAHLHLTKADFFVA